MAEEPLIYREELTATLFAISDINESVYEILRMRGSGLAFAQT